MKANKAVEMKVYKRTQVLGCCDEGTQEKNDGGLSR